MTDKEPIIVHGVDVSKCDRLNLNSAYGWDDPDMCSISCCKNGPNCLFKQLARYRKALEEIENLIKPIEDGLCYHHWEEQIHERCQDVLDIINKVKE